MAERNDDPVFRTISSLDDEGLLRMAHGIERNPADFTAQAIAFATAEVARRGGMQRLKERTPGLELNMGGMRPAGPAGSASSGRIVPAVARAGGSPPSSATGSASVAPVVLTRDNVTGPVSARVIVLSVLTAAGLAMVAPVAVAAVPRASRGPALLLFEFVAIAAAVILYRLAPLVRPGWYHAVTVIAYGAALLATMDSLELTLGSERVNETFQRQQIIAVFTSPLWLWTVGRFMEGERTFGRGAGAFLNVVGLRGVLAGFALDEVVGNVSGFIGLIGLALFWLGRRLVAR